MEAHELGGEASDGREISARRRANGEVGVHHETLVPHAQKSGQTFWVAARPLGADETSLVSKEPCLDEMDKDPRFCVTGER